MKEFTATQIKKNTTKYKRNRVLVTAITCLAETSVIKYHASCSRSMTSRSDGSNIAERKCLLIHYCLNKPM